MCVICDLRHNPRLTLLDLEARQSHMLRLTHPIDAELLEPVIVLPSTKA